MRQPFVKNEIVGRFKIDGFYWSAVPQVCPTTCPAARIETILTLHTDHVGVGCDRDTYSLASQVILGNFCYYFIELRRTAKYLKHINIFSKNKVYISSSFIVHYYVGTQCEDKDTGVGVGRNGYPVNKELVALFIVSFLPSNAPYEL